MEAPTIKTKILPIDGRKIGRVIAVPNADDILDDIDFDFDGDSTDAANLQTAAHALRHADLPVAFPTETVYGLGADATRSEAVKGIYKAKQRPADNPLIVHFASLRQLRNLLQSPSNERNGPATNGLEHDPIPAIYRPLISRFWPGPLTIILPNPSHSPFAPEVTAGLDTFGARIPRHVLALALIRLAGVPIAAPSANASTKPSPTAAEHVAHDLDGRIEIILDGGPCDVGVESTVVDGLSDPPLILRPGGISMEQIRSCPGWENTEIGYQDVSQSGQRPKAPGMKYRHYSPKATVVLYESGQQPPSLDDMFEFTGSTKSVGIVTTKRWEVEVSSPSTLIRQRDAEHPRSNGLASQKGRPGFAGMLDALQAAPDPRAALVSREIQRHGSTHQLSTIALGYDTSNIARGIFSALRELDRRDVGVIFVEGINESEGHTAAAVMNRLRKAAEINVSNT